MAQAQARLAQQQQAIRHRRVGSQDMDVDEANYCETQVTEEDDEDEDPDDSEQVHELKVRNTSFLACHFDADTKMAHLGSMPVLAQLDVHVTARFTPSTSSTDTCAGAPHSETRCALSTTA